MLVQEFLTGAEFSVQLVGNPDQGLRALPILEVDYSRLDDKLPKILGYESKWLPDSPYWTQIKYREATLADQKQQQMIDSSSRLFERLGCRDYARFDFRADAKGEIKLLEVNPNPGWCWDGKMNIMAGFQGMRYSELLGQILLGRRRAPRHHRQAGASCGQRQRPRGGGGVSATTRRLPVRRAMRRSRPSASAHRGRPDAAGSGCARRRPVRQSTMYSPGLVETSGTFANLLQRDSRAFLRRHSSHSSS